MEGHKSFSLQQRLDKRNIKQLNTYKYMYSIVNCIIAALKC